MVRDTNMEKLQDLATRLRIQCIQATEASKSGYDTSEMLFESFYNRFGKIEIHTISSLYHIFFKTSLSWIDLYYKHADFSSWHVQKFSLKFFRKSEFCNN